MPPPATPPDRTVWPWDKLGFECARGKLDVHKGNGQYWDHPSNVVVMKIKCDGSRPAQHAVEDLELKIFAWPERPAAEGLGFVASLVRGQGCQLRGPNGDNQVVIHCDDMQRTLRKNKSNLSPGVEFEVCFPQRSKWTEIDVFESYLNDTLTRYSVAFTPPEGSIGQRVASVNGGRCPHRGITVESNAVIDLPPIDLPGPLPVIDLPPMALPES
jgi:hypothetical protein